VDPDRRRRSRRRPSRLDHRHAPARQAQAHLHPAQDDGDNVIVINADKVKLTGKKLDQTSSTGTPATPAASRSAPRASCSKAASPSACSRTPSSACFPRGPLGRRQMKNLRVYAGAEHPHEAQQPQSSTSPRSTKNVRA
jgi:large subunit ribosomal protein L13